MPVNCECDTQAIENCGKFCEKINMSGILEQGWINAYAARENAAFWKKWERDARKERRGQEVYHGH